MEDEFSLRDDLNKDINDSKNAIKSIAKPLTDKGRDSLLDGITGRAGPNAINATDLGAKAIDAIGTGAAKEAAATALTGAGTSMAAGEAVSLGGVAIAEGAAAGAAGGPVGVVVGAAAAAAINAAKAFKNLTDVSMDSEDNKSPKINMFILMAGLFIFIIVTFCGTLISKGTASVFSISQETEFQNTKYDGRNRAYAGDKYLDSRDSSLNNYCDAQPLGSAIYDYIWENSEGQEGFRETLHEAIRDDLRAMVENLEYSVPGKTWDGSRTLSCFYNNPWPYDLQISGSRTYPAIGDVLHPSSDRWSIPAYDNTYQAKYDDVNWAEVMTILSQNSTASDGPSYGIHWGDCNFKDFRSFIRSKRCRQYMYEVGITWIPIYQGTKEVKDDEGRVHYVTFNVDGAEYDSAAGCISAPSTIESDGVTCEYIGFWNRTVVKPFGLRELYALADVDPEAKHVEFWDHTNYYMLDYTERVTRIYQRDYKVTIHSTQYGRSVDEVVDALGPSYKNERSTLSPIYNDLKNNPRLIAEGKAATGRSAWYYIEKTFNKNLNEITYPPYELPDQSKSEQMSESLSRELAYYFPDGVPTSAEEMAKYLTTVEVQCLDKNGNLVTRSVTVHKLVAPSLQAAMSELASQGKVIYEIGGYAWRSMATSSNRSMHSYGLAIDVNVAENYMIKNGRVVGGNERSPGTNPYSITESDAAILKKNGWQWGGDWHSSKDYMHFSVTGY